MKATTKPMLLVGVFLLVLGGVCCAWYVSDPQPDLGRVALVTPDEAGQIHGAATHAFFQTLMVCNPDPQSGCGVNSWDVARQSGSRFQFTTFAGNCADTGTQSNCTTQKVTDLFCGK